MADPTAIPLENLGSIVAAIGALGLAAFALVDTTKLVYKGGISHSGFGYIVNAVRLLLAQERLSSSLWNSNEPRTVLDILHANWINGTSAADQQAIAKSLIKLRLTEKTALAFARATQVEAGALKRAAKKMFAGRSLDDQDSNILGRFDLQLTAILDEGYKRADQRYRNSARLFASIVAVVLAVLAGWAVNAEAAISSYVFSKQVLLPVLAGLLATPLAPISKDLASALQAGVKVAQALKK